MIVHMRRIRKVCNSPDHLGLSGSLRPIGAPLLAPGAVHSLTGPGKDTNEPRQPGPVQVGIGAAIPLSVPSALTIELFLEHRC